VPRKVSFLTGFPRYYVAVQPGSTLGPYTVLEQLGAGGMGVVYRARDTRLGRDVALKVLLPEANSDPTSRRRLLNEARAASALNHPNVVTVYETSSVDGIDFIAMECIQGETLATRITRGEIPIPEVLSIALHVAEGLAAAHAVGLVHRDLKPSNIMITRDGRAKILDFGLAQRIEVAVISGATQSHSLTMSGAVVGTLAYMSPEQARGDEPGPASDIFAYGAVLYEMLCRERPFEGKTQLDVYHQICYQEPVPIGRRRGGVPLALADIIGRALAKKPEERFESMAVIVDALRSPLPTNAVVTGSPRLTRPPARPVRWKAVWAIASLMALAALAVGLFFWTRPKPFSSVAVLPFVNATGDSSLDYLVEGLSDGLRRDLTRLKGLTVASPESVHGFRGPGVSIGEAADKLRVSAVMTGKVSAVGTNLRLEVVLRSAANSQSIWEQSYDLPRGGLVRMANRLWVDSADQLGRKLGASKTRHSPTPKAYDLYLKGQSALARRGMKDVQQAVSLFQQSVAEDDNFGPAYTGLAEAYHWIATLGEQPAVTVLQRAKEAARRAVELDPTLAQAQLAYAITISLNDSDWAGAERAYRRSIELDPRSAQAHSSFALNCLAPQKRFEEALVEAQQSVDLEPDSPLMVFHQAEVEYLARHYAESIRLLKLNKAPTIQNPVDVSLSQNLIAEGRPGEAIALLSDSTVPGYEAMRLAALGNAYAAAGRREDAERIAVKAEAAYRQIYSSPCDLAAIYVPLHKYDKAIQWLRECRVQDDFNLWFFDVDPRWDPIRTDPRFEDLVRSIGLQ